MCSDASPSQSGSGFESSPAMCIIEIQEIPAIGYIYISCKVRDIKGRTTFTSQYLFTTLVRVLTRELYLLVDGLGWTGELQEC